MTSLATRVRRVVATGGGASGCTGWRRRRGPGGSVHRSVGPSIRLLNRRQNGDVIVIHSLITTCLPVVTCFTAAAAAAAEYGGDWWRCAQLWRLTQRTVQTQNTTHNHTRPYKNRNGFAASTPHTFGPATVSSRPCAPRAISLSWRRRRRCCRRLTSFACRSLFHSSFRFFSFRVVMAP